MKKFLLFCVLIASINAGTTPLYAGADACPLNPTPISVNITTATTTLLLAGTPAKKIYVWQFVLENNHATVDTLVTIKDGTTALNGGGQLLKAAGGAWTQPCSGTAFFITSTGADLNLTTSAAGTISGQIQVTIQ